MAINALEILQSGYTNTIDAISDFASGLSPTEVALGAVGVGAVVGGTAGVLIGSATTKKKATRKKKKKATKKRTTTKRKKRKLKFGSPAYRKKYLGKRRKKIKPKYARTAGKRRDTSTKRIRMTKHGQPYIILKSGKARFIKKSSAKRSRKLKGGRY